MYVHYILFKKVLTFDPVFRNANQHFTILRGKIR